MLKNNDYIYSKEINKFYNKRYLKMIKLPLYKNCN